VAIYPCTRRAFDEEKSKYFNDYRRVGGSGHDSGSDRKHLTSGEVEMLIGATKGSRNEARGRCLLGRMFSALAFESRMPAA
jgi:hypothetical protein